ncbi:hypothetical protein PENSPDRAFT_218409 [Peniophora sp. CONT]|nr:hypothetical protein PENSPDRAFT_218409 [Peniophora sp. CONT]
MDYTAQLPEKTLLIIFRAAQVVDSIPTSRSIANNDSTLEQEPDSYRTYLLAWVNLTYVCKRWRKLAVGDPGLWTKIPVVLGARWLREFISRSQDLPIFIDYDLPIQSPKVTEELKTIVPFHYHRMRNFHAWLQSDSPYYPLLSSPWPVLEDLQVWLTTVIPKYNLLANEASPLRSLSFRVSSAGGGFHRCDSFPWEAPFLRTLNTLDLLFREGIDAATMGRFLDALVNMPGLQHLRLWNEIYLSSSSSSCPMCSPHPRRINLPLKTLAFGISTYPMIEHMLQHIVPPASARIILDPVRRDLPIIVSSGSWIERAVSSLGFSATEKVEDRNIGALHRTSARLAATWESLVPAPPPFTSLQLLVNHNLDTVNIHTCRTPSFPRTRADQLQKYEWFDRIDGVHPDVTINTYFGEPWSALCSALRELADEHVRMLWLVYQDIDEVPSSSTISTEFPSISILRLSYPFESPYLQILTGGPDTGAITAFLSLKVLDFEQCYVRDVIGPPGDIIAETSLTAVLSARREAGIPIVVYLRLAEEIDDLRNGRQHSCSEYANAAAVEHAVDALIATPEVRIIGKEEAVPYAAYL